MTLIETFTLTDKYDLSYDEIEWRAREAAERRAEVFGNEVDSITFKFLYFIGDVKYYQIKVYGKGEPVPIDEPEVKEIQLLKISLGQKGELFWEIELDSFKLLDQEEKSKLSILLGKLSQKLA